MGKRNSDKAASGIDIDGPKPGMRFQAQNEVSPHQSATDQYPSRGTLDGALTDGILGQFKCSESLEAASPYPS